MQMKLKQRRACGAGEADIADSFGGGLLLYILGFGAAIHHRGTIDNAEESDVIIVLGAGLLRDGRPGWALTRRSLHGAELWRRGMAPYVLCAGGKAESYPRSEAAACREVLLSRGVPADAIILEDRSRSTEENAIFSRRVMIDEGLLDAVLVSDSYHMLRASWLFQLQGIETTKQSGARQPHSASAFLSDFAAS